MSKSHYYPAYTSEKDTLSRSSIISDNEDELLKQYDELYKAISNVYNKLDSELIRKYFNKGSLLKLFKFFRYSQNKAASGGKQALIEVDLSDLKKDIRNMSDDEIKNTNLDLIEYFVEKIIDTVEKINNQEQQPDTTDIPDIPRLETAEVVLVHCNLVNNNYQQASKVLFTFVPNKQFGQLITITPHSLTMMKKTNAEFSLIEIWFTDQNNRSLEIEDNVNITLIIGIS